MTLSASLNAAAGNLPVPRLWTLLNSSSDVIYWRSRNSDEIWCGVGCAFEDVSLERCRAALSNISIRETLPIAPLCFGSVAFDPRLQLESAWSGFASKRFWIPQLLLRYRQDQCDQVAFYYKNPLTSFDESDTVDDKEALWDVVRESSNFSLKEWRTAVSKIQAKIRSGELMKAVLSRQTELTADASFDLPTIFERLAATTEDSYLFALRREDSGVFFGASPERLFRLEGKELAVDSLAGSRPNEGNLTKELELSQKDSLEQGFVTRYIQEQLDPLCVELKVSEPRVKKLETIQHLFTEISGTIRDDVTAERVLSRLHPTPAVCGTPTEQARDFIAEIEPHARGLYAGTVGVADAETAEFAVAIRSGLIHQERALLFAGAGIVADSDADKEFEECNWKFAALRHALLPNK